MLVLINAFYYAICQREQFPIGSSPRQNSVRFEHLSSNSVRRQRVVGQFHATKDAEAIKDCIRGNKHVAITLYGDFAPAALNSQPSASSNLPYFQDRLPLRVVNH